jgi:hypothetical protein
MKVIIEAGPKEIAALQTESGKRGKIYVKKFKIFPKTENPYV